MEGSSCKTPHPESKDGKCVRITNCPALKDASIAAREDIQKYQCGFDDELLVCCKTQDIVVASEPKYLKEFSSLNIPNRAICGRIKGDNTKSEYPWLAALMYSANPGERYFLSCAGSLINKRFILTAASCFDGQSILNYRVLLGTRIPDCHITSDCPSSMQDLTVKQIILHPFFNSGYELNDIALVRLGSDIVFNAYVSPVCLPPPNLQPLRRGSEVTMVGWADAENGVNNTTYLWDAQGYIENPNFGTTLKQELCIHPNDSRNFCNTAYGWLTVRAYKDQIGQNVFLGGISLGSINCDIERDCVYNVRISAYTSWILRTITETT